MGIPVAKRLNVPTLIVAWTLTALGGCGMAMAELPWPANAAMIAQARRGASAWGCRERSSEVLLLYLECPSREATLGFTDRGGMLAVACPDSSPGECEKLAQALLIDGATHAVEGP